MKATPPQTTSLPALEVQSSAANTIEGQPSAANVVGRPAVVNVFASLPSAEGQPAAADAVGQPAAAQPIQQTHKISVGDIGIGKSGKWKDKYNGKKCKVLMLLTTQVKVTLLEGVAKGQEHKYLYKDFTVTEPVNREPPEEPPLPPPDMAPASTSTGPASSSTGPASSSTGPEEAFEGTAAAEVPEAAAVEQPIETMDDIFNAAFP